LSEEECGAGGNGLGIEGTEPAISRVSAIGFDPPRSIFLDLIDRYESALPVLARLLDGRHSGGMSAGWKMSKPFCLSAVGENLMQAHHAEFGGDPGSLLEIKGSVYGQITWRR
jgi:hypothetical protein